MSQAGVLADSPCGHSDELIACRQLPLHGSMPMPHQLGTTGGDGSGGGEGGGLLTGGGSGVFGAIT